MKPGMLRPVVLCACNDSANERVGATASLVQSHYALQFNDGNDYIQQLKIKTVSVAMTNCEGEAPKENLKSRNKHANVVLSPHSTTSTTLCTSVLFQVPSVLSNMNHSDEKEDCKEINSRSHSV